MRGERATAAGPKAGCQGKGRRPSTCGNASCVTCGQVGCVRVRHVYDDACRDAALRTWHVLPPPPTARQATLLHTHMHTHTCARALYLAALISRTVLYCAARCTAGDQGFLHGESLHSGYCEECAKEWLRRSAGRCPQCRARVQCVVRVYGST